MTIERLSRRPPWRIAAVVTAAMTALAPMGASAHVRWFVGDGNVPPQPDLVLSGGTFLAVVAALAAVGAAAAAEWVAVRWTPARTLGLRVARVVGRVGPPDPALLYRWLPPLLAAHVAAALLVRATERHLFVPNLAMPFTLAAGALALGEILVALGLLAGAVTRVWALGLVGLWALGVLFFGPLLMLEHAYVAGIGLFLAITRRGPLAVDRLTATLGRPLPSLLPYAVPVLRVTFGAATMLTGFTEKIWNPAIAAAFLRDHPFNLAASFPGPLRQSDETFVFMAGLMEAVLGALLVSGRWPRTVTLLMWVPFNLAIPFLGAGDLVGHLPIFGIFLVLLAAGTGRGFAEALAADAGRAAPLILLPRSRARPQRWGMDPRHELSSVRPDQP